MSDFAGHFVSGIAVGAIAGLTTVFVCDTIPFYQYTLPVLGGIIGALTPDMDIKSKSSQILYALFTIAAIYLFYIGRVDYAFYTMLYAIIPQFFKHRGFAHSIIFGLISAAGIFGIMIYNINNEILGILVAASYFIGFLTHLILDD